jgi:hypothetical protein
VIYFIRFLSLETIKTLYTQNTELVMNIRLFTLFAVAGLLTCMVSCAGSPSKRPKKIVVSCARGMLSEKAETVAVIPFDTSSSESQLNGRNIGALFASLLGDLNYTVKDLDQPDREFKAGSAGLGQKLRKDILTGAAAKGIDGVVFGTAAVKQGNTVYTVVLQSSASGKILWTIVGENAAPREMIGRLKRRMYSR